MNPLFDPAFPHGTPTGFTQGCKTNHCPALISCRVFYTRYRGDHRFRTRFDSGETLASILELDRADAMADRPTKPKQVKRVRRPKKLAGHNRELLIPMDVFKRMLADGMTDRDIAAVTGLTRPQVSKFRNHHNLPCNRERRTDIESRLATVEGLSNDDAATALGLKVSYVVKRRAMLAKQLREQEAAA